MHMYIAVKLNVKVMCCLVTLLLAVIQKALLQEVHLDRLVRFAVAIFRGYSFAPAVWLHVRTYVDIYMAIYIILMLR